MQHYCIYWILFFTFGDIKNTYMKIIMKLTFSFTCLILTLTLLFSSCKKDDPTDQQMIQEEASDFKLVFGHDTTLAFTSLGNIKGPVDYVLSFDGTADIKISTSINLHDRLKDVIQIDRENKKIVIKSGLLYPNSEVSTINGVAIPPIGSSDDARRFHRRRTLAG